MTAMPQSDRLVEELYDLVNRIESERVRTDVARTALLAAEYKAAQLAKKEVRMAPTRQKAAAPADKIDMACQRIAEKCRAWSMAQGGDESTVLNWLSRVEAQVPGQQGTAGGSLGDSEKVTKAAADPLGDMLSAAAAKAGAASQAARDQSAAFGMFDDLFGWRK